MPHTLNIATQVMRFTGDGLGAVAYISPDQRPEELARSFDAQRTVTCLRLAADAIERGEGITRDDGIDAMRYAGEAWARLVLFHRQ